MGDECVYRLALVRRERRDVHQRRYFRMGAGLGDHRLAVGMADENDRAVQRVYDPPSRCGVPLRATALGSIRRRHCSHLLEQVIDSLPRGQERYS